MKGCPAIIGMNVLSELQDLLVTAEGVKKMDTFHCGAKEAKV